MDHYIPCMFTAGPTKAGVEATVNYGSDFSERNTYDAGDYPDQDTRLWKEEDLVASFGEFCATTSSKFDLAGLIRAYGIPACPELGGGGATVWAKRMRSWNRRARYEELKRSRCGEQAPVETATGEDAPVKKSRKRSVEKAPLEKSRKRPMRT